MVKIQVLFFGLLAHDLGAKSCELILSDNATVENTLSELCARYPALHKHRQHLAIAVNLDYVDQRHVLHDGDELALIPPVSGG